MMPLVMMMAAVMMLILINRHARNHHVSCWGLDEVWEPEEGWALTTGPKDSGIFFQYPPPMQHRLRCCRRSFRHLRKYPSAFVGAYFSGRSCSLRCRRHLEQYRRCQPHLRVSSFSWFFSRPLDSTFSCQSCRWLAADLLGRRRLAVTKHCQIQEAYSTAIHKLQH